MSVSKQVILVRKDIKMPKGKLAAQVAHASLSTIMTAIKQGCLHYDYVNEMWESDISMLDHWLNGSFTKVCLAVDDLSTMECLYHKALAKGVLASWIVDEGRTCFVKPTITCCAIGPSDSDIIDDITGHLKLL